MIIFRLFSAKINISVLTQSLHLFPITICRLPLVPLLHLLILSFFLKLSVRLYLTLVGVVLWEMQYIDDNGTWDLVSLPTGKKAIGCRLVFAIKFNPNGSMARLKACLVAKGYA